MKYDTFDTKVAEELSPICKDLFWFMHSLDSSGLQWDTNEVLEALEDVRKLEAVAKVVQKAASRDVDNRFKYAIQINDDIRLPKEMWWAIVDVLADLETQHEQIENPAN